MMVIAFLALIAAILRLRATVALATIASAPLWCLANLAHAETVYSHSIVPLAVVCPDPTMTAYLESPSSPPHFSSDWQWQGGHSHCRSVKKNRALIVTKVIDVGFNGRQYKLAEIFPAGAVISTDGFGGPYYILASRITALPTPDQMMANFQAFMPTVVHYNTDDLDMRRQVPPQPPAPAASGR